MDFTSPSTNSENIRNAQLNSLQISATNLTLCDNLRMVIQDELIWIDLNYEESASLIHQIKESDVNPTGKQKIVIPVLDFYSKEIDDDDVITRLYNSFSGYMLLILYFIT